jgi:hypothetical protein
VSPTQTRHGCPVFLIAFGRAVKNHLAVLEFAASNSPYDDALYTRQEVTQLLRRPDQLNAAHHG